VFCQSCGAGEQSGDAYCKRCGEWLPETTGIARRALWGDGIAPERRLKTVLVRQILSAILALASAIILFANNQALGTSSKLVNAVAIICLLIVGMEIDGFFIALRLRQSLRRIHAGPDAMTPEAPMQSGNLNEAGTAQLAGAGGVTEETTKELGPLAVGRKRVE
jgi:hypothetical protein